MHSLRPFLAVSLLTLGLAACGSASELGTEEPAFVEQAGADGCGHDTWSTYAEAFVAGHCGSCHRTFGAYEEVESKKEKVLRLVEAGKMPKGHPLGAAERARFVAWLQCDLPR